jgi:HEPN domain-containing protein
MKPPDDALRSLVRQWIGKAEVDYRTAERLLRDEQPIRESIAFHCQQAVEKYLKALLVARQIEFPKTHSIAQLLDLIAVFAPDLAEALADTIPLTPFGIQIRYPGDFAEILPGQERMVFELARKTKEAIVKRLEPLLGGNMTAGLLN